jgi:hypothetical protein
MTRADDDRVLVAVVHRTRSRRVHPSLSIALARIDRRRPRVET